MPDGALEPLDVFDYDWYYVACGILILSWDKRYFRKSLVLLALTMAAYHTKTSRDLDVQFSGALSNK